MANTNLHKAKEAKNDEFYTRMEDVSEELKHYREHFKDKIVLCNCDDPTWSAFWKHFHLNFEFLGLKKLISTHYDKVNPTYKMVYEGGNDGDTDVGEKIALQGNGDFRNEECIELLKEADIVVTNPPFSQYREYVKQLVDYNKKFIIWSNNNSITYKEIFPLIKENKMWLGYIANKTCYFQIPDSYKKWDEKYTKEKDDGHKYGKVPAISVFTNLDIKKRHDPLIKELWRKYYDYYNEDGSLKEGKEDYFPKYDNYDAINVNKVTDIPIDYYGVMGVPITFLDKFNPDEFEILGSSVSDNLSFRLEKHYAKNDCKFVKADGFSVSNSGALRDKTSPKILGKGNGDYAITPQGTFFHSIYDRIFICKKKRT